MYPMTRETARPHRPLVGHSGKLRVPDAGSVSSRCTAEPGPAPILPRYDPGSAAHRMQGAACCAASGEHAVKPNLDCGVLASLTIDRRRAMADTSKIKEHMDVISSDRKTVGQ